MGPESQRLELGQERQEVRKPPHEALRKIFIDDQEALVAGRHERVLGNTHYQSRAAEINSLFEKLELEQYGTPKYNDLIQLCGQKLGQLEHFVDDLIDSHIVAERKEARRKVYAFDTAHHTVVLNGVAVSLLRPDFARPPKIVQRAHADFIEYGNRELEIEIYPYHSSLKKEDVHEGAELDDSKRYQTLEGVVRRRKKNKSGTFDVEQQVFAIACTPDALRTFLNTLSPAPRSDFATPAPLPRYQPPETPVEFSEAPTDPGGAEEQQLDDSYDVEVAQEQKRPTTRRSPGRFRRFVENLRHPLVAISLALTLGKARDIHQPSEETTAQLSLNKNFEKTALETQLRRDADLGGILKGSPEKYGVLVKKVLATDKNLKQHDRHGKLKFDHDTVASFIQDKLTELEQGKAVRVGLITLTPERFRILGEEIRKKKPHAEDRMEREVLRPLMKLAKYSFRKSH